MRLVVLGSALVSALAVAQPQPGVWGGYVTGWQPSSSGPAVRLLPAPALQAFQVQRLQAQQWWAWQRFTTTQVALAQQLARPRSDEETRAEEVARAALQAELAREQQRVTEQQALLAEQRLAAQQEALRLQQQLLEQARERTEAARQALVDEQLHRARQREAEQALEAEREALRKATERAEAAAKPRTKGPDIHRWVDEDGVVHYSTRPKK